MKKVRNRDSPMSTWLGGACCTPRACLRREKTMMSLVNEVIMSRIAGARVRTVSRRTI